MLKTYRRTPSGWVLGLSLLATIALGAAPAAADQIYVVDQSAGTGFSGALFQVDAVSGNRSLVSDFGDAAKGLLGIAPRGLTREAGGTVLVIDADAGTGFNGALFRVNVASGNRSLVSDFGDATQGPLGLDPFGLVQEAGGTVLVIDFGNSGALFRVNVASGNRSLVSDFGDAAQGPLGIAPRGLALQAGTVLVIDDDAGTGGLGALFQVDAISGNRSLLSDFGNAAQGPLGFDPFGLAVEAGGTALVIDVNAGTGNSGALFRVDPVSGNRSLVSDFGNAAQGRLGIAPVGLTRELSGTVLVTDLDAGAGNSGALFRVERVTGRRTQLSDFGDGGQGDLGADPVGVAVVVPNCFGRVPTVVGGNGNNVLIGSPRADVIVGLAGADLILGGGGDDRICGGDGNDALRGGPGNDGLSGGAGTDTIEGYTGDDWLQGNAGTDLIIGGKGKDLCQSGEVKVFCER